MCPSVRGAHIGPQARRVPSSQCASGAHCSLRIGNWCVYNFRLRAAAVCRAWRQHLSQRGLPLWQVSLRSAFHFHDVHNLVQPSHCMALT